MAQPTLGSLITRLEERDRRFEEFLVRFEVAVKRLENMESVPSKEERDEQSKQLDEFILQWRKGRIDSYIEDE